LTHESTMVFTTKFHTSDSEGKTHIIVLDATEISYMITFVHDMNHLFTWLSSLNRWEVVSDDEEMDILGVT